MTRDGAVAVDAVVRSTSIRRNFAWTISGNVVYAGCQWAMLVVLTKLGTPEMVGQFSLGQAVTAPVIMLANLQLRGVQVSDARREFEFGDYLGLRLVTSLAAFAAIVGIVLLSQYRWETRLVILVIGLAKATESISDIFYGLFQLRDRYDYMARSMIIKGPLSLLGFGVGVFFTGSVLWGAVGLASVWALVLILNDNRLGRVMSTVPAGVGDRLRIIPFLRVNTLARLAWVSLPLGLVMALISLNTNIPRYMIERSLGEKDLGIFSAITYLIVAGTTVIAALGQSASPRLAAHYSTGNLTDFRRLLSKLVGLGFLLGGAGVVVALGFGKQVLMLLYTREYGEYADVFTLAMVAAGIGYVASFLGYGMTAARCFKAQLPLFGLVLGVTALSCFLLIPTSGLKGAAVSLIIGASVQTVGSWVIILHAMRRIPQQTERGRTP